MPLTGRIDPDTGIAFYSCKGDLSREDVITALEEIYRDPGFRSPWRSLWDLTGARPLITADGIRTVVDFVKHHRPEDAGKIAIVATEDLAFGMGRMYELLAGDLRAETRVFRDSESARSWLAENEAESF